MICAISLYFLRLSMDKYLVLIFYILFTLSMPQTSFSASATITQTEWDNLMQDKDFAVAEQKLGEVYKETMGLLSDEDKQTLRAEQRAWVTKREEDAFVNFGKGTSHYAQTLLVAMYPEGSAFTINKI